MDLEVNLILMPTLQAAIPVIVATATYIGIACDIGPDLAFLVREFSTVFLRKNPSDRKVRTYGVKVSKVGLKFAGLLATSQGMKAIMKTGILQKAGLWIRNSGESGSVRLSNKIRNSHLAGNKHPKTGVRFDESGFPNFDDYLYKGGKNDITIEPTGDRLADIVAANQKAGYSSTPKGFTWHHHQITGRMQLVDSNIHAETGHTGGFSLWNIE